MQSADQKIKKKRTKIPRRSACPLCGCKELLTEGPDQFCLSCDWDTCAEYVERGWMDNLEMSFHSHFPGQAICGSNPIGSSSLVQPKNHKKPA